VKKNILEGEEEEGEKENNTIASNLMNAKV